MLCLDHSFPTLSLKSGGYNNYGRPDLDLSSKIEAMKSDQIWRLRDCSAIDLTMSVLRIYSIYLSINTADIYDLLCHEYNIF